MLHELTVIGEAAGRLSMEFRERHGGIPWRQVIGFRNVIVHGYSGVSGSLVWQTATEDVPDLEKRIAEVLHHEFGAVE